MPFEPDQGTVTESHLEVRGIRATIYHNDAGWYFCCDTCGNCGTVWHDRDYALMQALLHIFNFDHTTYLEENHGHSHE